jgi:hypothetical protein
MQLSHLNVIAKGAYYTEANLPLSQLLIAFLMTIFRVSLIQGARRRSVILCLLSLAFTYNVARVLNKAASQVKKESKQFFVNPLCRF